MSLWKMTGEILVEWPDDGEGDPDAKAHAAVELVLPHCPLGEGRIVKVDIKKVEEGEE